MHVDGFRFDLASVFGRDRFGNVMVDPPVVETITEDGVLADTKLIAEPWDAAGLYQVGKFPFGRRWSEWNGKYRDDVRRFWKGEADTVGSLATRLTASSDLYEPTGRKPTIRSTSSPATMGSRSTTWFRYDQKHNAANGEDNRDGSDENWSWNCGIEGPTDRSGGAAIAATPGPQPDGNPFAFAGRANAAGRRRIPANPAAAIIMPGARTTKSTGSIGRWPRRINSSCDSRAR